MKLMIVSLILVSLIFAGDFPVTAEEFSNHSKPAVAFDGTNYLVVWGWDSNDYNICGQFVSPSGLLVGSEFAISNSDELVGGEDQPAIAFNGADYLVVWSDEDMTIYGQRVSTTGALIDTFFKISSTNYSGVPCIAYNGTDGYLIVWQTGDMNYNIYGQRVSTTGALLGNNFPITAATGDQSFPRIAFDGTNYFVVWGDSRNNGCVYGRRIGINGTPAGNEIRLVFIPDCSYSDIAFNGIEYLLVWNTFSDEGNIYGQKISTSATLIDSVFPICTADSIQLFPRLIKDGVSYFVIWIDRRLNGNEGTIYGQRINPQGLAGSEIPISISSNTHKYIALVSDGEHFLVVWEDDRNYYPLSNIYGNIDIGIMHDAATKSIDIPLGVPEGSVISPKATIVNYGTESSFDVTCQIDPGAYSSTKSITDLASGDSIQVTFTPDFTFASGAYTVKVYTQLGGDMCQTNDTLIKVVNASGIAENGNVGMNFSFKAPMIVNGKTNLEIILPRMSNVILTVYNIIGCQCYSILNQKLGAGSHNYTVDFNLPAGIYFYTLKTDFGDRVQKFLVIK